MNEYKSGKSSIRWYLLLTLLAAAFAFGVFVGAGMGLFSSLPASRSEVGPKHTEGTFRFIRGSVESNTAKNNHSTGELKPFQYKVNALIENALKNGEVSAVSVYFRDLNNGNWFGIREHDKFSPKNELKVPLMIAYFKWAEASPVVLRKTLKYTGKDDEMGQDQGIYTKELAPGKSYTVNDLIFKMIAHDDAASYSLLYQNLPPERFEKIFKDLYVEYDPRNPGDSLSLSAFASFFRVLYNSSYLSEEMSEKALRYLSKTSFQEGMKEAIPPNIDIAAKEGERSIPAATGGQEQALHQLHEFGIVYHPARPFLLGVMVRGDDVDRLAKMIRNITRLVYEEVDQQS